MRKQHVTYQNAFMLILLRMRLSGNTSTAPACAHAYYRLDGKFRFAGYSLATIRKGDRLLPVPFLQLGRKVTIAAVLRIGNHQLAAEPWEGKTPQKAQPQTIQTAHKQGEDGKGKSPLASNSSLYLSNSRSSCS